MSYSGHPGQHSGPPPTHPPQPGYGPPPGPPPTQYSQGPPQGGYPPQGVYAPPGHPPPPRGYGEPVGGGYPPSQGAYGGGPPQGAYGAPPHSQWGQPPPQQYAYGQAPPPSQYGQAPPPTPPYSGSFPPQGYPQGNLQGEQIPPQQGGYGAPPTGQYNPQQQMSGPPAPPSPGYDPRAVAPMDMTSVATDVRNAMKGFGTNDKALIKAVAKLDPLQIAGLRQAYKSRINRDIEKDITSETSGDYRDGLIAIVQGPLLHDVQTLQKSIKGMGTKERMLNDVLLGRSNADMRAIKAVYRQTFSKDMVAEVKSDLSLKTERHFEMIMAATRNEESTPLNPQSIDQDVNAFHDATEGQAGTAELKICEIMTNRSDGQIRAIGQQYQQRFQKSLDAVIRSEFSGHMEDALLLQLARATDRAMSDATQFEEAMKGMGTKDDLLVQRVVRVHWNRHHLDQVKKAYAHKFKTKADGLEKRVAGEVSGHYKDLMLACLA